MKPAAGALLAAALLSCSTIAAATCANPGSARSGTEILDDAAVTSRVKLALRAESGVAARDIEVRTCRGDVQLSGFVDSQGQIDRAGRVTADVEGVRRVTNELMQKPMELARSRPACKPAGHSRH